MTPQGVTRIQKGAEREEKGGEVLASSCGAKCYPGSIVCGSPAVLDAYETGVRCS